MILHLLYLSLVIFQINTTVAEPGRKMMSSEFECDQTVTPVDSENEFEFVGSFRPTFYQTLDQADPAWPDEPATEPLYRADGSLIATVEPSFKHRLDIEGSGRLRDGRVVNIDEKIDESWRYLIAKNATYGISERGSKLIPYRTIAVDPDVVKLGSVLYIPALKGIQLPSGEIHDGYVLAQDTGQGIDGYRMDLFVGFEVDVDNTLTRSRQIHDMRPTCVYQVDPETSSEVKQRFRSQFAK